jgi:putative endonuclease
VSVGGATLHNVRSGDPSGPAHGAGHPARVDLGRRGEAAAAERYRAAGYRVIARNWRCPLGELDLVVARGSTLVFCEVKTRRGTALGGPYEAVGWQKQRKLQRLAEAFMASSRVAPDAVRFDVASVSVDRDGRLAIHLFEAAF